MRNIQEGFEKHPGFSRILPGTVSELSRNWYEENTKDSPSVPGENQVVVSSEILEGIIFL
ncbi:MAG: hypothetical protein B7Y19_04185 [Sphingobacteriales bacterium 24-40-4]|nr:MAG: hypothetical protein B7Y19_04185 [Sphingobacteriales bacterium 24-40-4]